MAYQLDASIDCIDPMPSKGVVAILGGESDMPDASILLASVSAWPPILAGDAGAGLVEVGGTVGEAAAGGGVNGGGVGIALVAFVSLALIKLHGVPPCGLDSPVQVPMGAIAPGWSAFVGSITGPELVK